MKVIPVGTPHWPSNERMVGCWCRHTVAIIITQFRIDKFNEMLMSTLAYCLLWYSNAIKPNICVMCSCVCRTLNSKSSWRKDSQLQLHCIYNTMMLIVILDSNFITAKSWFILLFWTKTLVPLVKSLRFSNVSWTTMVCEWDAYSLLVCLSLCNGRFSEDHQMVLEYGMSLTFFPDLLVLLLAWWASHLFLVT